MKSNGLLKVVGILMIIGGSVLTIIGIIAAAGVGLVAAALGSEANMTLLLVSAILLLLNGIVTLVAGILGVANAAKPAKAGSCIVFGVLAVILAVLSSILNVAGGNTFSPVNLLIGLVLPVLYLIGAFQNKKRAGQVDPGQQA
jgi:hypothetical protein